jgi:hypothetical protein
MSLRDLMWLCYLKRDRVSGEDLLFEKNFMKGIKLKQVIDVIFNLHSERLSILSDELRKNQESLNEKQQIEKTLLSFIDNQGIMPLEKLEEEKSILFEGIENNKRLFDEINVKISGSSDIAKDLRENVLKLNSNIQNLRRDKRNIEKTLQRLIPLRGQYHEDISKLNFLSRAKQIIDPLTILFCPSCLSPIKKSETKDACPLCGNKIKETEVYENLDVTREIRTIERKLDELNTYVEDIETRHKDIEKQEEKITNELKLESKKLDDTLQSFISPFLSERDAIVSIMSKNQNEIKHIDEMIKVRNDIITISKERIELQNKQEEIERTIEEERKKSVNRAEVINSLSKTYFNHLQTVNFPKLLEAFIDDKLVPYVRGLRYNDLSSDGAINLSSICWITAIFAEAIQRSTNHPGFLMLDNIQAGIGIGAERDRDFQDETIVDGIYTLLKELSDPINGGQLIVVDNHPPNYMKKDVIVYYSRDPKRPPYGFIDDETT